MPEIIELRDVHLYGLDEDVAYWLGEGPAETDGRGDLSLSHAFLRKAEFAVFCEAGSGRYRSSYRGELRCAGAVVLADAILKVPLAGEAGAEGHAEDEAAVSDRIAALEGVFPNPLGYCWAQVEGADGPCRCNLQGGVPGSTLEELLYDDLRARRGKVSEFLLGTAVSGDSPAPCIPDPLLVAQEVFLPVSSKMQSLEDAGRLQHNDVSPSNIVRMPDGEGYRFIDLSLVDSVGRPLRCGGTVPYAPFSNTRLADRLVHKGMDIRALAAICWELMGYSFELECGEDAAAAMRQRGGQGVADGAGVAGPGDGYSIAERHREARGIRAASAPERVGKGSADALVSWALAERGKPDAGEGLSRRGRDAVERVFLDFERDFVEYLRGILLADDDGTRQSAEDARDKVSELVGDLRRRIVLSVGESAKKGARAVELGVLAVLLALAFTVGLAWNLALPSLPAVFAFIEGRFAAFFALSAAISVLPVVLGTAVDSPIAWGRFSKREAAASPQLNWRDFKAVAKYGSPEVVVKGEGRYDPSAANNVYYGGCDVAGMLCSVSLFATVSALGGSEVLLSSMLPVALLVPFALMAAALVAWITVTDNQHSPSLVRHDSRRENPDCHRFSRIHVWANILHLVWTFFWVIVLCVVFAAFLALHGLRTVACPWQLALVLPSFALFVFWISVSPRAISVRSKGVGTLLPGSIVVAAVAAFFSLAAFLPSPGGMAVAAEAFLFAAAAVFAAYRLVRSKKGLPWAKDGDLPAKYKAAEWLAGSRRNASITLIVLAAVAVFLGVWLSLGVA